MDEFKKKAIEEKNKTYRSAVTEVSEKLNDLEKNKGIQFKRVRDKTLEDEGKIQDDIQMMFARELIEKANAVKLTNPKEYYELLKKAREILKPTPVKDEKKQMIADLERLIKGEKSAEAHKEALASTKEKSEAAIKELDKMVAEKKFDEVEKVYTELISRSEAGSEKRKLFEAKLKELFKAKFNDKLAAADKLAEEKKFEEARNAYGEARKLAAENDLHEEQEIVETKVKELNEFKEFEGLDTNLETFLKDDIFMSPSKIRDVLKLTGAGIISGETINPESVDSLSADVKRMVSESKDKIAGFINTSKRSEEKKVKVKENLMNHINGMIEEINSVGKRDAREDSNKDLNPHKRFISILRSFEKMVKEA